jgi:HNH endonuclease
MTAELLLAKVTPGLGGCWIWTGATTGGYGVVSANGRIERAHRVSYELAYGKIPDGLHLDHLCRVRACIRPDHLEAVTQAENNRRAGEARTQCPAGHELPPHAPGKRRRQCQECKSEYDRRRYAGITKGESA